MDLEWTVSADGNVGQRGISLEDMDLPEAPFCETSTIKNTELSFPPRWNHRHPSSLLPQRGDEGGAGGLGSERCWRTDLPDGLHFSETTQMSPSCGFKGTAGCRLTHTHTPRALQIKQDGPGRHESASVKEQPLPAADGRLMITVESDSHAHRITTHRKDM